MQQGLCHGIPEAQPQGHPQGQERRQAMPRTEAESCLQHEAVPRQLCCLCVGRLWGVFEEMRRRDQDSQAHDPSQARQRRRCMPEACPHGVVQQAAVPCQLYGAQLEQLGRLLENLRRRDPQPLSHGLSQGGARRQLLPQPASVAGVQPTSLHPYLQGGVRGRHRQEMRLDPVRQLHGQGLGTSGRQQVRRRSRIREPWFQRGALVRLAHESREKAELQTYDCTALHIRCVYCPATVHQNL